MRSITVHLQGMVTERFRLAACERLMLWCLPSAKSNDLTFLGNKDQSQEPVKSSSVKQMLLILNRKCIGTISHLVLKWEIKEFTLIGPKSILSEKSLLTWEFEQ